MARTGVLGEPGHDRLALIVGWRILRRLDHAATVAHGALPGRYLMRPSSRGRWDSRYRCQSR